MKVNTLFYKVNIYFDLIQESNQQWKLKEQVKIDLRLVGGKCVCKVKIFPKRGPILNKLLGRRLFLKIM